jgi:hypothetical protein
LFKRASLSKEVIGRPWRAGATGIVSEYLKGFTFLPGKVQPTSELSNPAAINPREICVRRMILIPTEWWQCEEK